MADHRDGLQAPRRTQGDFDATDLTNRFEQLLSSRRLTELSDRAHQRAKSATASSYYDSSRRHGAADNSTQHSSVPPTYSSLRNTPKIATPPQDPNSLKFRALLNMVSMTPLKYENPGLLDEALGIISSTGALARIYTEAEEESQILQAQAASIGDDEKPEWGYQDCLIRALLRYETNPISPLTPHTITLYHSVLFLFPIFLTPYLGGSNALL